MATSTFPAARSALYTTLKNSAALAGVFVSYGFPLVAEPEFVAVVNGKGQQAFAAIGTRRRDESNETYVLVQTLNSDPADAQTPLERAFTLMAAIEDALRADPSLGGVVRVGELISWELEELAGTESRGCQLLITVHLHARI